MPPPSRDSAALEPTSLGRRYFELRELDLQLALSSARPAREDVEDELCPIDDLPAERLFQIAQLRRAQLVIEDHHARVEFVTRRGQRFDLAAAKEGRRVGPRTVLENTQDDRRPSRSRKACELVERMFGIDLTRRASRRIEQPDEGRALAAV